MADGVAARRYAQAVFEIAEQSGEVDRWLNDLRLAAAVLQDARVGRFMANPGVPFEKKQQVLASNLSEIHPLALNLLYLLIQQGHLHTLPNIADEFQTQVNERSGVEVAEVTTAIPLSDEQASAIVERLATLTGKRIILNKNVDPAIIGGMVAKVGDKLIDGSVKGKMAALREQLK